MNEISSIATKIRQLHVGGLASSVDGQGLLRPEKTTCSTFPETGTGGGSGHRCV